MIKNIISYLLIFVFLYTLFYYFPIYTQNIRPMFNSQDKLWAHRVLDTVDVNKLSKEFLGVEIDVFYDSAKNIFDVRHHGKFQDKSFENFLNSINKKDLYLWVDLKNLNEKNLNRITQKFKKISKNNNLQDFMIIESKEIELLNQLKIEGFKISYWLPSFNFFKSIYSVFKVKQNIKKYQPDAISCSYHNVDFYSKKFPNYNLHCWTNGLTSEEDKEIIKEIVQRKNVKVILTDFKTNFLKEKQNLE